MGARGIDHLVIAVNDLDSARAAYERLGFALTPVAHHPFGTKNSLVQLGGAFLELVAIDRPELIPEATPTSFSFAAFNRDFLAGGEGPSMLALKSRDANLDLAEFSTRGMRVYDPFRFERQAKGPGGDDQKVAFSLTFTGEPRIKRAAFFTCQHLFPENFWNATYQTHANGALSIAAVAMTSRDPADFHEFVTYFSGEHDMRSTSLGVEFDTGDGSIDIFSPLAVEGFYGVDVGPDPEPRLVGCRIAVADLAATRAFLAGGGVGFNERLDALVVPPAEACGCAVAFVGAAATP